MRNKKILFLSDDFQITRVLHNVLSSSFSLLSISNLDTLLSMIPQYRPHLLLIGPYKERKNLIKQIQRLKRNKNCLPIVFVGNRFSSEFIFKLGSLKVDHWIDLNRGLKYLKNKLSEFLNFNIYKINLNLFSIDEKSLSPVILDVINILEKNFPQMKNSMQIARKIRISREHLSRKFKKETGYSFQYFKTCLKVAAAIELMKEGARDISHIALVELDYSNVSNMTRDFQKVVKCTPVEVLKNINNFHFKIG